MPEDQSVTASEPNFTSRELRDALGQFCTGITVITAVDEGAPVGFACQSFSALSLDPPLVLFCPMKTSGSWPRIERTGRFAVNILSEEQEDVSSTFGRRGEDKFASIDWSPSPLGSPVIDGVMAWFDCRIESVLDGGDHWIVLGRVSDLGPTDRSDRPLLFYRGAYMRLEEDVVDPTPEMIELENFITSSGPDTWL
ncbi:3-hydroxy-9,10-secoandrosta-1,3,5(10)-triene-9,17-dione monooxygenase reductase subunit [Dietzia sp.]|uniref:3-hydroxy-9,10-secoandrosta-1,3,5(10)-triene-9, 17-dione monooxygenase reductase subunit n=1 Tax=Dietzia sp. TaxID=1871616 RepID=UPI002FDA6195